MGYTRPPPKSWLVLGLALVGVSSGGPLLASMPEVPPFLRASWRLWATSLVLLPGFILQREWLQETGMGRREVTFLLMSGLALGVHFAAWTWSLDHTSLAHSLLFVTSHPIVIVAAMVFIERRIDPLLVLGAFVAFSGAAITLLDADQSGSVTYAGDAAAFIGAVAGAAYLGAGRAMRSGANMPLFIYAFPVTAVSAAALTSFSMAVETIPPDIESTPVGWIDSQFLWTVSALALGAGLLGHTGLNASLKWMPPIVVSVGLLFEPIIGSLMGLIILGGVEVGMWTLIGGVLMISGAAVLTVWLEDRSERSGTD